MRALGIEATLSMKMNVYSEVETEILKDMYSLDRECVLEKKEEGIYEEMLMQNQAKCKIAERLTLPELKEDVLQIIHSEGSIQAESERYTEEGVEIEGILHISFLYLRADDEQPYGSWTVILCRRKKICGVGKKYMTTVPGIMNVNRMENENVKEGDKLLIFKENMSIL